MPSTKSISGVCFLCFALSWTAPSGAQESGNDLTDIQRSATSVFLDFSDYQEYIKTEIPFVNYVRDRKEAQVHVMLTQQETGSGGREYTLTFIGQQNFTGLDDTLQCVTRQMDPEEVIRRNIVRTMKIGLVRYVSKTPLARDLSVEYRHRTDLAGTVDRWNYWVFNAEAESDMEGQESSKEYSIDLSLSADRVTPAWKMSFGVNSEYNKEEYDTKDRTISSHTRSQEFESLMVKSLGEHISAGFYGSSRSSIFSNTKFSWSIAPAIEFNVFPYSESTRREFRILYRTGFENIRYHEETIFGKTRENKFSENLSGTFEAKEQWGSLSFTLEGSHYFHDFEKNRLRFHTNVNLRLFEGFSLNLHGNIERIHDQLSLPREGATEEEILLHQRQLATQYDVFLQAGLRYTFGSIYSNVVNPRFGNN
ncbi:MAG: hypothetical protein ACYC9O_02485 [Candidatus Latescibacterota bacterium]